ncbi:major facilitator superfamily domain-containing protein 1-like [Euwallacea fornicatus]|uniref:major facilitator superfamily domain-containing protein 1-like n=1 Tax=Euwallacea fornicatus TaxID=995702 RepID=UPI00338D698A
MEGEGVHEQVRNDETCCDRAYFLCCHPNGKAHRFIALIFMCLLGFGSYFCYDNPSALQAHFQKDLNITETQYTILYSIYSWPNTIMCFFGGFLIDRVFGIRAGSSLFMGLTLIGQLIFTFAVYLNQYWMLIMGRFVFGVGSESLAVAQNNYAVLWFKGKELNMVFGIQMSITRMGSTANFWVMEPIYNWISSKSSGTNILGFTLLLASTTCLLSMICSVILGYMDKRAERITMRANTQNADIVKLTDVKDFKASFWLVTCICVTYYNAIFPFVSIAQGFLKNRFNINNEDADHISSVIYLISGITSPFSGLLIDKAGLNLLWILISIVLTAVAHMLLGFFNVNPYVGIVLLGLAYSVLASGLWPLVAIIIPEYQLGTAYGVCQAIQNLGLALVNILTGWIVDRYGYKALTEFFVVSLILSFIFASILLLLDQHQQGILNLTASGRKRRQEMFLNNILERQRLLEAQEAPSFTDPGGEELDNSRSISGINSPD